MPIKCLPANHPDLTPHLVLDDKVLKDIIVHLYYPDSPYEFSVLPADAVAVFSLAHSWLRDFQCAANFSG